MLAHLLHDLRYAARNLRRNRGFVVSAIVIIAVGIAASTGLFAVIDAVVLRPLPYDGADRLARVGLLPPAGQPRPAAVAADEFATLLTATTLDAAFIRDSFTKTLAGSSFPESVWTEYYTGNALALLGVRPMLGRVFTEAEAPVGAAPQRVAVLTHRFWQRYFAGQPDAIGRTLRLDGEPFIVIGVVPSEYSMDLTDIILPLGMAPGAGQRWPPLVRVRTGISMAAAEAELQRLFEGFARNRPDAFPQRFQVQLRSLVDEERGAAHVPILTLLFAAATLLLLIGCVNVTILLLARGQHRVHEMALRYALGASRGRLVALLFCETLLITLVAAVCAVIAVQYVLPVVLTAVPGVVSQRAGRIDVGAAAIIFATSLAALVAMIAGIWPAAAVSRARHESMRSVATVRTVASRSRVSSGALIAAQVAVAVLLLAGTGAAIRGVVDLYRTPPGYDPTRVTVAQIYLPAGSYLTWPQRVALYERLRAEVGREASVESSTISLIPTGPPPRTGVLVRIDADGLQSGDRDVLAHAVASDYFSTLKMSLERGRAWSPVEDARGEAVAVVNETLARQLWPNEDARGKRLRDRSFVERRPPWVLDAPGRDGWFEVVGVVRDVPNRGLRQPIAPAIYFPYTAALSDTAVLIVRTKGSPPAAERDLRMAVSRADGSLPIIRFITPETFMDRPQQEFVTAVLLGFAGVALLLASFGLFSVASYSMAHRAREFGIRIALGAAPGAVLRSAFQSMAVAVTIGLGLGLWLSVALAAALSQWSIRSLDDPIVLATVAGALLLTTIAATAIPARRAVSIAPAVVLKGD